jgi:hypothetical protein
MLGLQKGALQSFVLENDPVPRALLSVDPTFTAFKQTGLGAALLQLRHFFLGPGVPLTPERFLADNVGQVNLIRWTPETGHKVSPHDSLSLFRAAAVNITEGSLHEVRRVLAQCSVHIIQYGIMAILPWILH